MAALRYEAHLFTVSDEEPESEPVDEEDYRRVMKRLLPGVPRSLGLVLEEWGGWVGKYKVGTARQ